MGGGSGVKWADAHPMPGTNVWVSGAACPGWAPLPAHTFLRRIPMYPRTWLCLPHGCHAAWMFA